MQHFSITAYRLGWINGEDDDPHDLCLHGSVTLQLGKRTLDADGTVSATALYLLRTLTEDRALSGEEAQMVPCCGHFLIANADRTAVTILGCNTGLDWATTRTADAVCLTFADGTAYTVDPAAYRDAVLAFADRVEAFYAASTPKILPDDQFARDGYAAFWNEWHRRRNAAN